MFKFFDRDTLCAMQLHGRVMRDFVDGLRGAPLYEVRKVQVTDDENGEFEIVLRKRLAELVSFKPSESADRLRHVWARNLSISAENSPKLSAKQVATMCEIIRQVRPRDLHLESLDFAHFTCNKFLQVFPNDVVKKIVLEQCTMPKKFDTDSFVRMCAGNGVLFVNFSESCLADGDTEIVVTEDVILDFCFRREVLPLKEAVGLRVDLKENTSTFLQKFLEVMSMAQTADWAKWILGIIRQRFVPSGSH